MKSDIGHYAMIVAVAFVTVIFMVGAGWYYYTYDPSDGAGLECTFKLITGYDCPGCGSQRALHAFLHGDIHKAWSFNPMIFFAIPIAVYYLILETGRRHWPRLHATSVHPLIIIVLFIAVIAYWIGRNI